MRACLAWLLFVVMPWVHIERVASADAAQKSSAPAWSARLLVSPPTDAWATNGGNIYNQRYSPLRQIERGNVAKLKAEWRASLRGSGLGARSGNQAQPIVYDGVVYIMTGDNDAFAISVDSGTVLWEYKANIDPKLARPCCSWVGRGLALGEEMIFVGQLDAKLVALDRRTGKVVWSVQAEDPKLGYVIASAPLYYNGMVITGFAGSDMGIRGRLKAFDARTGKLRWTFYTVPGPGEPGHQTWPADTDVWKHGGAAIWQTPAVDPELGLIYFSTANPGPVLNGRIRQGDNLFSVSIVALDVATGRYRWHFQQVHHDIWDYDSPNPVILFDATYGGIQHKAIAEAAKTGWVYILDRVTGKPLVGIVETPVMQEPRQLTSPTQPFPVGDAVVPQSIDIAPEGFDLVNEGRIFTPFTKAPAIWKPLAAVNWPPSSYDPDTHLMYICASDSLWGATGGDPDYPVEPGALYSGSVVARFPAPRRGVFAVIDLLTNRLVWRQQWVDQCYSGSLVTAGGLLFVGRNDGRLTALDKTTGRKLWEFQTDGGVNAPASTFEYHGKQYVVVLAGGTALAGSKRSDGLWLFSLDGKMDPLPKGSADPTGQFPRPGPPPGAAANPGAPAAANATTAPSAAAAGAPNAHSRAADIERGKDSYTTACVVCHGVNGKGGTHGGPAFTRELTSEAIFNVVTRGRNDMPPFGAAFSADQLQDLSAYVLELASH
ncbi:MAG TPA: PQQ-binding-like beta-propeller repeat protein [Steroidobacteraceae bacterium]|nr:PQQ-binding-like beta-propeller repeat protein [Steroidobacteraceae bacterium]